MSSQLSAGADTVWGPLAQPITAPADLPEGSPPWRDNAWLPFWDDENGIYGTVHVSTSPNAGARQARFSLQTPSGTIELIEPLDPGSFESKSIRLDLDTGFTISNPEVTAELRFMPQFARADFVGDASPKAFGGYAETGALKHYQQAASVVGSVNLRGQESAVDGSGFRDRTWGFRDETIGMSEYFGFMWKFETFALSVMRLYGSDGSDHATGFLLGDTATPVAGVSSFTRDGSGLFVEAEIELDSGDRLTVASVGRPAGQWVPMGPPRTGAVMSAYDEFHTFRTASGEAGGGIVEQGYVRRGV